MKNVSAKLLKAIESVGGKVQKTGYNSFSKYKYITESDINEAILPALVAHGLLLTTSVDNFTETPSSSDNKNRFATVKLTHTIIDTESGEFLTFNSVGTAADTLDKAIFKALTGACKYFAMKLFLISGDDSDPENDGLQKPVAPKANNQGFLSKKTEKTTVAEKPTVVSEAKPKGPAFGSKPTFATKPKAVVQQQEVEVQEKTEEQSEDPGY